MFLIRLEKPGENKNLQIPSHLYSDSRNTKLYCTCTKHAEKRGTPSDDQFIVASVSSQEIDFQEPVPLI